MHDGRAPSGVLVLGLVGFGARSFALAPGLNGSSQVSAASALSASYIGSYVAQTSGAGPNRRLGFLALALRSTVFDGSKRAILGLGPQTAVIGTTDVQVGPTNLSVLATASVQSVPRILLGFGLLGLSRLRHPPRRARGQVVRAGGDRRDGARSGAGASHRDRCVRAGGRLQRGLVGPGDLVCVLDNRTGDVHRHEAEPTRDVGAPA